MKRKVIKPKYDKNVVYGIGTKTECLVYHFQNKQDEIFENALRTNANPPIKGDITFGKIRWRGIKIMRCDNNINYTRHLEQRGIKISEDIIFTGMLKGILNNKVTDPVWYINNKKQSNKI